MKVTPFIAAAIVAFTPAPARARAVRLTATNINQSDVAVENPGPMPLSVLPDGKIMPGAVEMVTETTSTGFPLDSHPDNPEDFPHVVEDMDGTPETMSQGSGKNIKAKATPTDKPHSYPQGSPNYHPWGHIGGHGPVVNPPHGERKPSASPTAKQHSPLKRPGSPIEMSHGPVVHPGMQAIAIPPTPTTAFSNLTGRPLTVSIIASVHDQTRDDDRASLPHVPFHRLSPGTHDNSPRDLKNPTPTANVTSLKHAEEIAGYVNCRDKPVNFTKVISYVRQAEKAMYHHLNHYKPLNNDTSLIVKGLRFKVDEEIGMRLLEPQEAEMTRYRLCQAKHKHYKH